MESANRKSTDTKTFCDIPSPVLIRRRLSAPETIMRKYKLARAKSQESDSSQDQPKFCDLSYESHSGSDINLQKKKESAVLMRKSTLLRRLMNNPKTLGSSSFQEWQHYCGKLSNSSLNSLQGSPEHLSKSYSRRSLVGYEFKTSPKHNVYGSRKVSPVRQTYEPHQSNLPQMKTSPKRRIDTHSDSYSNYHSNPFHGINSRIPSLSSQKTNANSDTPFTTSRTTIFKDHSDSAYSNDRSNVTPSSISSSSTNTNLTAQEYTRYRKPTPESISVNLDQRLVDENRNFPRNPSFNYITQESATQTASTTNLNVISNVKLSQKTLDLIVNEVMRDVQKTYTNGNEVVEKLGDSIHVRNIPGFENKPFGNLSSYQQEEIQNYNNSDSRISRINSSRLSTMSNKTLGIKSDKFTDDNSDIISLADSLDDSTSSRSIRHHDNKPVRGDLPPLLRNDKRIPIKNIKPADAFFIPMKTDVQKDVKSVSNYLPQKLREKILQRQQDLHEKLNQSKSTFKSKLTHLSFQRSKKNSVVKSEKTVDTKLGDIQGKSRYKKPFLPSIGHTKKLRQQSDEENSNKLKSKGRYKKKAKENHQSTRRSKESFRERDFSLYTTENEYVYNGGPKRIYHRAEFRNCHKRVEILEILECVDITGEQNRNKEKNRSKIPVFVNQKSTRHSDTISKRPTYLDFNKLYVSDPKLDQLIANILIQTLNEKVDSGILKQTNKEEKQHQEFEAISEENSQQSSNDDNENRNINENSTKELDSVDCSQKEGHGKLDSTDKVPDSSKLHQQPLENMYYKGKAAVELLRPENSTTIPDGWVAFYVPQRSEETIDNGSIEGKKSDTRFEPDVKAHYAKPIGHSVELRENKKLSDNEEYHMQSKTNARKEEYERVVLPPPLPKRCGQSSRRFRNKEVQNNQCLPAEWSIVLSGKNNPSFNSDLEMKIRFPSSRQNVSLPPHLPSESEENRENHQQYEKKSRFPRIDDKYLNYNTNKDYYGGSNGRVQNLPEINFNRETSNQRMSGSVASLRAMEITDIRPRQTKTSMRRYNMTRPKLHPLFESNIYDFNIDRQYPDILRRIPHFLAVNGNSLSSERKHHVPGMNRKDIPKHNCTPH